MGTRSNIINILDAMSDSEEDSKMLETDAVAEKEEEIYRDIFDKIFGYPPGHDKTLSTVKQWIFEWIDNRIEADLQAQRKG